MIMTDEIEETSGFVSSADSADKVGIVIDVLLVVGIEFCVVFCMLAYYFSYQTR